MLAQESALLRKAAQATCSAIQAEKANIAAGSPKDKIALCEANSLQAGQLLQTVIARWLRSL